MLPTPGGRARRAAPAPARPQGARGWSRRPGRRRCAGLRRGGDRRPGRRRRWASGPDRQDDGRGTGRGHLAGVLDPQLEVHVAVPALFLDAPSGGDGLPDEVRPPHLKGQRLEKAIVAYPIGDDPAEAPADERRIDEDVLVPGLPGEITIVVDGIEILGARDLGDHARHGQLERKALQLLALAHVFPSRTWPARPDGHARLIPVAISSGVRWTRIWLVRLATTSRCWLTIVVSVRIQTESGSSLVPRWWMATTLWLAPRRSPTLTDWSHSNSWLRLIKRSPGVGIPRITGRMS